MNVVDSSAWLEYVADGPNAACFADSVEGLETHVVPSLTLFEVFDRVAQQRDEGAALQAVTVMQQGTVVDLGLEIAVATARLSLGLKMPMADSVILANARKYDAELWTPDADFDGLERFQYRKRKP